MIDSGPLMRALSRQPGFNGPVYERGEDQPRLQNQIGRVFRACQDGRWYTLDEIAQATGDPPASVSAQLRHLRKPRFGSYRIEKRSRGGRRRGLWEYRLLNPLSAADVARLDGFNA